MFQKSVFWCLLGTSWKIIFPWILLKRRANQSKILKKTPWVWCSSIFLLLLQFLIHNHANSWWRLSSYENLKMYTHNISWNRWVKTCQKARRKVSGKFSYLFHENSDTVTAILVYSLTNIGILRPKYVYVSIRIVCTFRFAAAAVGTNFGLIFHSGKMICTISLVHLEY